MMKLRYFLLCLGTLTAMLLPVTAQADVNNFVVTNFQADESLSRADPQGELRIIEKINVSFTDNNHGILRAIPNSYKSHPLHLKVNNISSATGAPAQYTTYGSNGNTVLKIGDPSQTVTGNQEYTIDYTVKNVISFYNDHDELYWDVNGDQWQQNFQRISVTLHLPPSLQQNRQPLCYTGAYGSTSQNCSISATSSEIQAQTTSLLEAGQTLTYVAGFSKGYFKPQTWYQTAGDYLPQILGFFVPALVLGVPSILYWWLRGRDPKGTGIIVPQYDAPAGLKPMDVGTIMDFNLKNSTITATIVDLAIRGYLKIIETTEKKMLRKDTTSYSLQLANNDTSQLNAYERELLAAIFANMAAGEIIDISESRSRLYQTAKNLQTQVETNLTNLGYFRSNPLSAGKSLTVLVGIAIFVIYVGGKYLGAWAIAGIIVGGIIAFVCSAAADARTAKGVAAKEQILGLKMYLSVAEKDRLEKLQGPNAPYAANAGEPVKTVELFEKLLPFAMVLGVEKQWAGKFEQLYTSPPSWYAGNWATFNTYYLVDNLNGGIGAAVNAAFAAPSSSGASGFGGGFAGGGGGGGGGGGW